MPRLAKAVRQHLEKAKSSALAAVEFYNKPGVSFRTRTYTVLMNIAWTALFHAIFYDRKQKPWYVRSGKGRGKRYMKVDGEPKHWDLSKCVSEFYGGENPPERANLEFMIGLRNKIEHREYPELDPVLYGECQAMLLNFEDLITEEFGEHHALAEDLGVALQFSSLRPEKQTEALRRLEKSAADDVLEFIEKFRADLPPEVLESSDYSLKVFLIPKIANRESSSDLAVEFVPFDPDEPDEMEGLRKLTALIKEKRIPIASKDLLRPTDVVDQINERECIPFTFNMHRHTMAWKHYEVRPETGSETPHKTKSQFCVYDQLVGQYGYTEAWVKYLCRKLSDPDEYRTVTGQEPDTKE